MTFQTFDQSDEGIWPDQQKNNDKNKHKHKDNDTGIDKENSDDWEPEFMTIFVTYKEWHWTALAILAMFVFVILALHQSDETNVTCSLVPPS